MHAANIFRALAERETNMSKTVPLLDVEEFLRDLFAAAALSNSKICGNRLDAEANVKLACHYADVMMKERRR